MAQNSLQQRGFLGIMLIILFLITAITGIMLHLKSHGIILQPRGVLKVVHWLFGLGMAIVAYLHGKQFFKMLIGLHKRFKFFQIATWIFIIAAIVTVATGFIKLLSPVKIHGLGLFHYQAGLIMSIAAILHLVHALPTLPRYFRHKRK